MLMFYWAILESIIRYGITAWFGNLTVQLKSRLISTQKTAMRIIGRKEYKPIQSLYGQAVRKQGKIITADSLHPLFPEYELLPSGRRFRVPRCKTNITLHLADNFIQNDLQFLYMSEVATPLEQLRVKCLAQGHIS